MPRRAEGRRAGRVMRERVCCCAQAVSGAAVGLLLAWLQYSILLFRPYPPMCIFIQEEVIISQADDGSVKITDEPALIYSYVYTPRLKVRYENIRATLLGRHIEGGHVQLIAGPIELPKVDMGCDRFYTWSIHFNSSIVPLKPNETLSTFQLMTLELDMIMPWHSFWSNRSGVFHSVKITCSFDPKIIKTPVKCVSTAC